MNYRHLLTIAAITAMVLSCSNKGLDNGKVNNDKTPIELSPLMEGIVKSTPAITEVISEEQSKLHKDIELTQVKMKTGSRNQYLFIAKINLKGGLNVFASTSNDKAEIAPSAPMPIHAEAAELNGKKIQIGINGDVFWGEEGKDRRPAGVFYKDGKDVKYDYYREDSECAFYVTKDGKVGIDKYPVFNKMRDNIQEAIGGWHCIVMNGEKSEYQRDHITEDANPRTFIGLDKDASTLFLFVLDGRQSSYSVGLNLDTVTDICIGAGCYKACNLDGGGSSTLIIRQEKDGKVTFPIINKPYDANLGIVARAITNGILVGERR